MKAWMFILFLATGSVLSADVITSVTCSVGGLANAPGSTVTNPSNCLLRSPAEQPFGSAAYASASADAGFSPASDPSSFSILSISQGVDGVAGKNNNGQAIFSSANSQVSVNEALLTTGSVRSGLIQINAVGGFGSALQAGAADLSLSLGTVGVVCTIHGGPDERSICYVDNSLEGQFYQLPVNGIEYPFTLGQAFRLNYSSSAQVSAYQFGSAYADMKFQFRLFEADGVTPVVVEAVPEPGSLALLGVAFGVFAAVGKSKLLSRVRRTQR